MNSKDEEVLQAAVLKKSTKVSYLKETVKGYDWNGGVDYGKILENYQKCGLQATNFGLAVNEINKMIECREKPIPKDKHEDNEDPFIRIDNNCTIFLGYTSNIVSSGLRETIKFLAEHKLVRFVCLKFVFFSQAKLSDRLHSDDGGRNRRRFHKMPGTYVHRRFSFGRENFKRKRHQPHR